MGDTDNSDFGSYGFGKNCLCHVIPDAIRVSKMYILSMLEISRVITIPTTLCIVRLRISSIARDQKLTPFDSYVQLARAWVFALSFYFSFNTFF